MAYMSQEMKAKLAPGIKAVLKKYNMKGTISVDHHAELVVKIKSGPLFKESHNKYTQVNHYHIDNHYEGKERDFLNELRDAMMVGNHDNSNSMVDYFDVGWYISIHIGRWNKPYNCTKVETVSA